MTIINVRLRGGEGLRLRTLTKNKILTYGMPSREERVRGGGLLPRSGGSFETRRR